jgi:hypothetical protein
MVSLPCPPPSEAQRIVEKKAKIASSQKHLQGLDKMLGKRNTHSSLKIYELEMSIDNDFDWLN